MNLNHKIKFLYIYYSSILKIPRLNLACLYILTVWKTDNLDTSIASKVRQARYFKQ